MPNAEIKYKGDTIMKLIRCENGHFYDSDRFESCPHCDQRTVSTIFEDDTGKAIYTMPMTESRQTKDTSFEDFVINQTQTEKDFQETIGYFGDIEVQPVVGWLVAVAGNNYGMDFKLRTGRNFIGRSHEMDIALTGDTSISRDKHAVVLYEPKSNIFLVQPGASKELCYLNGKVVLSAMELNAYDVLTLGETQLMFIPCCSEKFNWDDIKPDKD